MFNAARAAGLPMLSGVDIFVPSAGGVVRAHYWAAGWPALDPRDQPAESVPLRENGTKKDSATIVILPGFTEFFAFIKTRIVVRQSIKIKLEKYN